MGSGGPVNPNKGQATPKESLANGREAWFDLTPGSPGFNPGWKNRDPGCKFPAKVQPGSFWRLAPDVESSL